jgi:hypothetical protein
LNREREIATAGGKVEYVARMPVAHDFRGSATPEKVGTAAQEMIREIVTPRDPAKHRPNGVWVAGDVRGGVQWTNVEALAAASA